MNPSHEELDREILAADARAANVVDLAPYLDGKGKIIPPRLAAYLRQLTPTATGAGGLYAYRDGVYRPADDYLAEQVHTLAGDRWTRHMAGEVLGAIRAGSHPLDEHPPLDRINLANGVYSITTGEMGPHTPELRTPVQLPVAYDPSADCPALQRWLVDTLDDDVAALFIEVVAYLLTPDNRLQRALMFLGQGGTGKTTALKVIEATIGPENVSHVALQQLDEHRFAPAQLYGRLANIHADLPSRAVNGTSIFKAITGGDPIMAERKGRDPFTFTPTARFVFSANEAPPTHDGTTAYFDRWTILPFSRTFRGTSRQDRNLVAKLTTPRELSGLLNLALAALPDVRRRGFTIGAASLAEHERFRLDSDPVAAFVDECCALDPDARTPRANVYRAYRAWCIDSGRSPLAAQRFTGRIRDRHAGAVTEVTVQGTRSWSGLRMVGEAS